jgi:hypothetical protein
MGILHNLKRRFSLLKIQDPDFGSMRFVYISNNPKASYWEGEWLFPATNSLISFSLPGGEAGPNPEGRQFLLELSARFGTIVEAIRLQLAQVAREWLETDLPGDLFTLFTLTGFGVDEIGQGEPKWDVSFESTGDLWLGISIPFTGDKADTPVVDT